MTYGPTRVRTGTFAASLHAAVICLIATAIAPIETTLRAQVVGASADSSSVLALSDVLDSVRTNHPLVSSAISRIRAARGRRLTAGALGNPILGYQVENAPFPGGAAPPMEREAMAMATLPLEPIYQRSARVRRANAEVRAATSDAASTRQRVALDAARAYYRTALAQVTVAAVRDLVGWLDSLVAYNRLRVGEGVTAETDLLRSQLERDRAVADLGMRDADLARAGAELRGFLGSDVPNASVGTLAVPYEPLPLARALAGENVGDQPGTLVRAAVARRPDVVAARERLTAAAASVSLERTMLLRQIGATIGAKRSVGATSMVAGLSFPVPLFDLNRGEVQRAAAERESAAFEVAAQERAARAEISGARDAARVLTDRTVALSAPWDSSGSPGYLARADEARRIALGAYREGATPLLQVLDAARAWSDARTTFYEILFAQHEAVLELIVAEGGDLYEAASHLAQARANNSNRSKRAKP